MVRFVKERAELVLRREELRGLRHDRFEQHDAGRKIRRGHDADAGVGDDLAQLRLVRSPAGRADDDVDAAAGRAPARSS